ncbi:ABC transporter permease [Actinomadura alba]|uniref:Transport permease protein n=1 Tax=Actinomadura alba TaxID=406431 RepID=A0ABR7LM34_9ACTN|nr:ABC transporter permease [Actinomadura alba]MBC6465905.1 ABC transporter permease [Actinomadura alba]
MSSRNAMRTATLPAPLRVGLSRGGLEVKSFFREKEAVLFTFAMPVILLVVLGAILNGEIGATGIDYRQYLSAGIIAAGIMSTTFVGIGVGIATERDDGTLKRLYGSPMPRSAYFIGKTICALVLSVLETALLLVIGTVLYGLEPPGDLGRWITFGWVFMLGVASCTLLGIAISSVPRSHRSASTVLNVPFLVLQFTSGVFFMFGDLPKAVQQLSALFPLKWMCQGLRSALLPDTLLVQEPVPSWEHGRVALMLSLWCAAGLALCLTTFRWKRRDDR